MRIHHELDSALHHSTEHTRIDLGSIDYPIAGTPVIEAWSVGKEIDTVIDEATGDWKVAPSVKPEVKKQPISGEHLNALNVALASLKGLTLPLEVSQMDVCDGWSQTLTIESGFQRMTLHWFCGLPPEWASVDPILQAIDAAQVGLERAEVRRASWRGA